MFLLKLIVPFELCRFDTEESLGDYVHKQQTVNSDGEFVDVEDEGSADDDTEEFYGEDSDNE